MIRSVESPFFHPIFRHWKIGKTEGENHVEDSTRATPEVLAKCARLEYASQIINGVIMHSGSADAVRNAIASHPGKGRTAGVLRRLPGLDAHAVAAESRARQESRAMVSVRILRRAQADASAHVDVGGDAPQCGHAIAGTCSIVSDLIGN